MKQDANPIVKIKYDVASNLIAGEDNDNDNYNYDAQIIVDEQIATRRRAKARANHYVIATWSAFAMLIVCTAVMINQMTDRAHQESTKLEEMNAQTRVENDRLTERNTELSTMLRDVKQRDAEELSILEKTAGNPAPNDTLQEVDIQPIGKTTIVGSNDRGKRAHRERELDQLRSLLPHP